MSQADATPDDAVSDDGSEGPRMLVKAPVVRAPDVFTGKRGTLRPFLATMDLYFMFHPGKFNEDIQKILFMVSYFRENAFDWFEPIMTDHFDNMSDPTERDDRTIRIMNSYSEFRKELKN